jgi:hypothetical protein
MSKAQAEIARLKAEVERWRKLAEPAVSKGASNVTLVEPDGEQRNLPRNAVIGFEVGTESIHVSHDDGGLKVYWRGGIGRLAVLPDVSNVLHVVVLKRA